jgi:glycosyltransferase involved in cell wall biosynthesis
MMKVLYVVTQSAPGGAQRYVLDLAARLPQPFTPVIAAGCDGGGDLLRSAAAHGIRTLPLSQLRRSVNLGLDQRAVAEMKAVFSREQPAVVHLNSTKAGVLGALAADGKCAMVYTVHGWVFHEQLPAWRRLAYRQIERYSTRRLDRVIVLSERDHVAGIKLGVAPHKLVLIRNGIDPPVFLGREEARQRLTALCGWPLDKRRLVLCIAGLYPAKGLPYLVTALDQLPPECCCVVLGEGPLRPALERQARGAGLQGRLCFAGHVPDASELLPAADVFVLPSLKEGLPYVLLEAMAARVPIVATRVGGIPELLEAVLVEAGDAEALAQAIGLQLRQPRLTKARPPAVAQMLEATLKCYHEALASKGGGA